MEYKIDYDVRMGIIINPYFNVRDYGWANLIFLSALKMLERLTADGRLSAAEQEAARRELERRLRPTLLFA